MDELILAGSEMRKKSKRLEKLIEVYRKRVQQRSEEKNTL